MSERVKACYAIPFTVEEYFNVGTSRMLKNLCDANSVPTGYVVPPLLAAVAHNMLKSKVQVNAQCCMPSCLYTMTCGYTSTNKSGALSLVHNAARTVEEFLGTPIEESSLNQCKSFTFHQYFNI